MFAGLLKVFQGAFQSFSVWTVYLIKKWGGGRNLVLQLMFTEEMVSVGGWLLGNREKRRRYAELYKNLP